MDREVVEQKLESLRRCVQRVAAKCPADAETLAREVDLQDIVTLNLSRAVQMCVDVGAHMIASSETPAPATMGQTFELLSQKGSCLRRWQPACNAQSVSVTSSSTTTRPSIGRWCMRWPGRTSMTSLPLLAR